MNEIKSTLLTPETPGICLTDNNNSCYNVLKSKCDISLTLNAVVEQKNLKEIGDQTPTPTRLIRNCEAVGLFDDLNYVNPFEETFRQAIGNKTQRPTVISTQKSIENIKCHDEDTLHTPNIVPYNVNITIENKNNEKVDEINTITTPSNGALSILDSVNSDNKRISVKSEKKLKISKPVQMRKFRKIIPKQCNVISTVPISSNPSNQIKEKIREALLKSRLEPISKSVDDIQLRIQLPMLEVPKISTNDHKINGTKVTIKRDPNTTGGGGGGGDAAAATATIETIERNREAAKRYRNRMKMKYNELIKRNAQLEMENAQLKQQLDIFKNAHKQCALIQNVENNSN